MGTPDLLLPSCFSCFTKKDFGVQGEIPNITSLPKPWGPKSYSAPEKDHSHRPPEAFSLKQLKLAWSLDSISCNTHYLRNLTFFRIRTVFAFQWLRALSCNGQKQMKLTTNCETRLYARTSKHSDQKPAVKLGHSVHCSMPFNGLYNWAKIGWEYWVRNMSDCHRQVDERSGLSARLSLPVMP